MILKRYIYGTNAFPAFHIGTLMERRRQWMIRARATDDQALRRINSRRARSINQEIIRALAELKQRQLDLSPNTRN